MPDITSRAIALTDSLLNRASTPAERQRLLSAFGASLDPPVTNAQAARAMVSTVQNFVIEFVLSHERRAAAAAAKNDFAESP